MAVDHEFGDQHTELKLSIVEKYLKFFTTALKGKFEELWYIDAFAGTGSRTIRHEERPAGLLDAGEPEKIERRRGSARIAIDVSPPFDFIVFIENKPTYFAALEGLVANHPNRRIVVVKNDANDALKSLIATNNWRTTRAVLFLDPYGMQLEWSTLEKVAATKAIDVWFLFSLAGLYRQATRDLADIDKHKRAALTRMFGSNAWEEELYPKTMRDDLEGLTEEPRQRTADVSGLEVYARSRLQTIFAAVLQPLPLPLHEKPQRFSLFFLHFERRSQGDRPRQQDRKSYTQVRHGVVGAAVEHSPGGLLIFAAPLFEEKCERPERLHRASISLTHSGFISRERGPLSPPTIAHPIPVRSPAATEPIKGSKETNLTAAQVRFGARRGAQEPGHLRRSCQAKRWVRLRNARPRAPRPSGEGGQDLIGMVGCFLYHPPNPQYETFRHRGME